MSITATQSSLFVMQAYGAQYTSQSGNVALPVGADPAADIFGSAVSYNLSDNAMSALGLGTSGTDALDDVFASLSYAGFATGISMSRPKDDKGESIDALLALFGTGKVSSTSGVDAMLGIGDAGDGFIRGGGPLPAFLQQVKIQLGLNTQQAQSLDAIALHFRDASDTPETVAAIATALQEAGITA